ncbi:MAG: c-type cytochrome [Sphingomonadaceae bacterium]
MLKPLPVILLPLALGACQSYANGSAGTPPVRFSMTDIAFAQASCGGCHAVEEPGLSPNPAAPTFAEIASKPGVTEKTLATYLRDAHNYPEAMDFELTRQQADALAEYMLTLRAGR